ncbi:MAG: hypothetical protein II304_04065 [Bacteroidales bacterium]|nr:hypothetical protein [Bacteroidales bacterium]
MFVSQEDKVSSRDSAISLLNELKEYERTHKLHEKVIGKCVVQCKSEERLKEYEKEFSKIRING